jgi:hypothetical protein
MTGMTNPAAVLATELAEVGPEQFTAHDYRRGTVRHIVLFKFAGTASEADRSELSHRFHALADTERDGQRYIVSIESGDQISGEVEPDGFEVGFLVTFSSQGDRNFYVGEPVVADPAYLDQEHAAFKAFAGPLLAGVQVFDFAIAR